MKSLLVLTMAACLAVFHVSAGSAANTRDVVVHFKPGSTSATMTDKLGSEHAVRYILGARKNQFLTVSLRPENKHTFFIIYVPGGDILYESSQAGNEYYGQLFKNGDHVVEVFYKGEPGTKGHFAIDFQIANSPGEAANGGGDSGMPSKDEQACLQAVSRETNNGDVVTLRVETSEANNAVIVGVGPNRAPWQCLVKNGKVAEVMSLTDEGAM